MGIDDGPTNHLCSSQVQCVNSLAPFALRPEALKQIFGPLLGIEQMRPMNDPAAPEHYVAFEWIGEGNPLGEWEGSSGTRGAKNTSADAAIRYLAHDGVEELALIEWKYTEQYQSAAGLSESKTSKATRDARYRHLFDDPDGPLRHDLVPYDDLYVEPVYQLMRLQLLASQLERAGAAQRVRLVLCAPAANSAYWGSLNRPSHRHPRAWDQPSPTTVDDVGTLWRMMQRRPDRFLLFDTAQLVAPNAPTSQEFKQRYGHLAHRPDPAMPNPFNTPQHRVRNLTGELKDAVHMARVVLQRVSADGSVLEQLDEADDEALQRAAPRDLAELTARLREVTELTRRVRADDVLPVLRADNEQR
ncbi:MAG: hypothetical protein U0V73_05595 [Acidimicrobiia bacterium]